jgi:hypothetical protein
MPKIRPRFLLAPLLLAFACDSSSGGAPPKTAAIAAETPAEAAPPPAQAKKPEPIPAATAAAEADDAEAQAVPEEEAAPKLEPKTILLMGSSMMATGFGAVLQDKLDEHPYVTCHRKAKSATGLARPDFFDWMATGTAEIEAHHPDLVIVLLGGNDGQDLQSVGSGRHVVFKTDDWEPAYRGRVDEIITMLSSEGAEVLWFGVPRTNTIKLEAKLDMIRGIHRAAVEGNDAATYLDLTPFLEGEGGELIKEIRFQGKIRDMRGDDGMHLTMAGSRYLADKVVPEVLAAVGLPPADELPTDEAAGEAAGDSEAPAGP